MNTEGEELPKVYPPPPAGTLAGAWSDETREWFDQWCQDLVDGTSKYGSLAYYRWQFLTEVAKSHALSRGIGFEDGIFYRNMERLLPSTEAIHSLVLEHSPGAGQNSQFNSLAFPSFLRLVGLKKMIGVESVVPYLLSSHAWVAEEWDSLAWGSGMFGTETHLTGDVACLASNPSIPAHVFESLVSQYHPAHQLLRPSDEYDFHVEVVNGLSANPALSHFEQTRLASYLGAWKKQPALMSYGSLWAKVARAQARLTDRLVAHSTETSASIGHCLPGAPCRDGATEYSDEELEALLKGCWVFNSSANSTIETFAGLFACPHYLDETKVRMRIIDYVDARFEAGDIPSVSGLSHIAMPAFEHRRKMKELEEGLGAVIPLEWVNLLT